MSSPASALAPHTAESITSISHEMIAQRAYEIWREQGGSDMENWLKAERELRGQGMVTV